MILLFWLTHTLISGRWVHPLLGIDKMEGMHDQGLRYAGAQFRYWRIPLFVLTHALITGRWVPRPLRIDTKVRTCVHHLNYSSEESTYWHIFLCWLTQCLTSERWVLLLFIRTTQAKTPDQETELSCNQYISSMCCSSQHQRINPLKTFILSTK